ncbi:MAG: alpha/beta hydrolase [Candidatus Lokiarchaeota archaeon]|nr:alpha/beta hydrolase [Candidatus Lokiarchaeota archaeon]
MKNEEGEFKGVQGIKIFYQCWLPEITPKAVVQIIHGFAEHSSRYINVINELVPKGYIIYANDHRGHGKSEGERGYVDNFNQFIDDVKILFDIIKEKHPKLPIFMLGHSIGSFIAMHFAKKYENLLKGLILSGSGIQVGGSGTNAIIRALGKLISKLAPHKRFATGLGTDFVSRDPEVVKAYATDPMVYYDVSSRLAAEMMNAASSIKKFAGTFKLPCLLQSGSVDIAIIGASKLAEILCMEDKTVKIYDGLFHEIYNEIEQDRKIVLKDLSDWLDKHI